MDYRLSQELRDRSGAIAWFIGEFTKTAEAWVNYAETVDKNPVDENAPDESPYMELSDDEEETV